MQWATPSFSRSQVNRAAQILISPNASAEELAEAYPVINNWRASHQYPLNTFQMTLRKKSQSVSERSLISQRIKRLDSIRRKLESTTMKMVQMQDIGGCRAVVDNVEEVDNITRLYNDARFNHVRRNSKDYINYPKSDGYRSMHLIYEYVGSEKSLCYNGLKIEIQIRSALQHSWATAVEAVGTFTRQALKWRGGTQDWQRFFVLMSSAMANVESRPMLRSTPQNRKALSSEIRALAQKLNVRELLKGYSMALSYIGQLKESKAKILLVNMRPSENKVFVQGYRLKESEQASIDYTEMEKSISINSGEQAVLVRVDSLHALQRAYPNYFLDTERFSEFMEEATRWR